MVDAMREIWELVKKICSPYQDAFVNVSVWMQRIKEIQTFCLAGLTVETETSFVIHNHDELMDLSEWSLIKEKDEIVSLSNTS